MENKPKDILVSVIIVIGDKRERAKGSIESVLRQDSVEVLELIVIDASSEKYPPLQIKYQNTIYISLEKRLGIGQMKEMAVNKASGYWIAFLEEHARALPGWLNAIKNLDRQYAGMGGEIHNLNNGEYFSNSLHYCNYYRWLPGTKRRECEYVAGHNSVYKREVLLGLEDKLKIYLLNESLLNQLLINKGNRLLIEPEFKIGHINESTIKEIFESYYNWHRCVGNNTKSLRKESDLRKIKNLFLILLQPFYRTLNILVYFITEDRRKIISYLISSPFVFLIFSAAGFGEFQGRLYGLKNAEMELSRMELDSVRTKRKIQ